MRLKPKPPGLRDWPDGPDDPMGVKGGRYPYDGSRTYQQNHDKYVQWYAVRQEKWDFDYKYPLPGDYGPPKRSRK